MFENLEDDRTFVIDSAIQHNLGSKEEIELYEELSLALELMQDDSFRIEGSRIKDGLDFNIVTPYPNGLPEKVGALFFNVNTKFDVRCEETDLLTHGIYNAPGEMNFKIKIKKI